MSQQANNDNLYKDLFWLTIGIGIFYFLFMGFRQVSVPDGARYSEIPREMLANHSYITPHLDGVKYFEKPPLFYWLQSLSIAIFGYNEWAYRLWNVLFGIGSCLGAYFTCRTLFNRQAGIFAAIVLATSLLFYAMAHSVTLDMSLAFFTSFTLFAFLIGLQYPVGKIRRRYMWLMYVFIALGFMTKGLIALAIPGMSIVIWMLLCNEWRILKSMYLISGIIIFLIISLPWHIAVQIKNPEFFHFYFIMQQFSRYSTDYAGRTQPFWFFVPVVLLGVYPWTVFLLQAIKNFIPWSWSARKTHQPQLLILIWVAFIFVFFTMSQSKLIPYMMPLFAPLSVVLGCYLANCYSQTVLPKGTVIGIKLFPIINILLGVAMIVGVFFSKYNEPALAYSTAFITAILFILTGLFSIRFYKKDALKGFLTVVIIGSALSFIAVNISYSYLDNRTIKPLALQLKPQLKPSDEIISYEQYYQDLPLYLQRRVTIVNWTNELSFGMKHQDTSAWIIDKDTFWKRWQSDTRLYMFTSYRYFDRFKQEHPNAKYYMLGKTSAYVLITNHKVK